MGSSDNKTGYGFTYDKKLDLAYNEHNKTVPLSISDISINSKKSHSSITANDNKLHQAGALCD